MTEAHLIAAERRLRFDNPWWEGGGVDPEVRSWPRRDYFPKFRELVLQTEPRRAVVLMGPRRVGKTVMIQQLIAELLDRGVSGSAILYASLDTPVYLGVAPEALLLMFFERFGHDRNSTVYVFFDEVQYQRDWEIHLKSLVDSFRGPRFIASGSAAAALKLRSRESGAGRFTDFTLPPLTFSEYVRFVGMAVGPWLAPLLEERGVLDAQGALPPIGPLNAAFVDYLNFGAFPEAALSAVLRQDPQRYVREDVLEKVLLRDLPGLYGIEDIQELYRLFVFLAWNTGGEFNAEGLSQKSGVNKVTLQRYLKYLEAAFLIRILPRVGDEGQRFQRAVRFKVYLTNPALRAALLGPVAPEDEAMGALVETAVVSQLAHTLGGFERLAYARWREGKEELEVDLVTLDLLGKPVSAVEIKWSDRYLSRPEELRGLRLFVERNPGLRSVSVTTRTQWGARSFGGRELLFMPTALQSLLIGAALPQLVQQAHSPDSTEQTPP